MRRVSVSYFAAARRWDIADENWSGRCETEDVTDGWSIGRRPDGSVAEIAFEPDIVQGPDKQRAQSMIEDVFGSVVAHLVSSSAADADVEATFELLPSGTPTPQLTALPGEPGVPVVAGTGQFSVPLASGAADMVLRVGRLLITVPRHATDTSTDWLRVSDGDTGLMLALGPIIDRRDQAQRAADIPFALDIQPDDLHLAVTSDPTQPVGSRMERRQAWAGALAAEADRLERSRPGAAAKTARQAMAVADSIDDHDLSERARGTARSAQRRQRWRLAAIVVVVSALLAVMLALPRLAGSDDPERDNVYYANCDAARRAGVAPLSRGEPGFRAELDRDNDGIACET